jgi:ABC-type Fe2+-enterobactin transport system substrate-binding protein
MSITPWRLAGTPAAAFVLATKVAGETSAETNYEAIATTKPDLIVIGVPRTALGDLDMKRLESIAPVVVIGPTIPDAWRDLSRRQSDAAGRLSGYAAAKDGKTFGIRYTEAATYLSAIKTLEAIDQAFAPLLDKS